jgi:hypothetical protein
MPAGRDLADVLAALVKPRISAAVLAPLAK